MGRAWGNAASLWILPTTIEMVRFITVSSEVNPKRPSLKGLSKREAPWLLRTVMCPVEGLRDELLEAPLGHKSMDSSWDMEVKQRSRERSSPSAHVWLLVGEEGGHTRKGGNGPLRGQHLESILKRRWSACRSSREPCAVFLKSISAWM